jgi:hypothetical protein
MTTAVLSQQRPTPSHPIHDHAAGMFVLGAVSCECGYSDSDAPGDDPDAFLSRALQHLKRHHPDVFDDLAR